jgi:hypothetical protein
MTAYAVPFPPAEAARSCFQLRVSLQADPLDQNRPLLGPLIGAHFYCCAGVMTAYAVPFTLSRSCARLITAAQVN